MGGVDMKSSFYIYREVLSFLCYIFILFCAEIHFLKLGICIKYQLTQTESKLLNMHINSSQCGVSWFMHTVTKNNFRRPYLLMSESQVSCLAEDFNFIHNLSSTRLTTTNIFYSVKQKHSVQFLLFIDHHYNPF